MAENLIMPKIGVNMVEATIVEWLVSEGETVKEGDIVLTAETDKAVQDIPASSGGRIGSILAPPGTVVQCQDPIASLLQTAETLKEADIMMEETGKPPDQEPVMSPGSAAIPDGRKRISPLARKLARMNSIEENALTPSRPGDRIVKADVLALLGKSEGYKAGPRKTEDRKTETVLVPVTGIRKVTAQRLSAGAASAVSAVLFAKVCGNGLISWRQNLKKCGTEVSYNDLLVFCVSRVLVDHPYLNSRWTDAGIELPGERNIGVAVDSGTGLAVPVIHAADRKSVREIAAESREKISRARAGTLRSGDLAGGTFTITNLGMFGIETFIPVINPPECAILGVSTMTREPVVPVDSDNLEIRSILRLSLVFDHRIVDGAPAARFLKSLREAIEDPLMVV